jgi:hypothetical protein
MCPVNEFLNTSQVWPAKTTMQVKAAVMKAAAGRIGRGLGLDDDAEALVVLGDRVTRTRPGPKAVQYESSSGAAGAHLLFNAFWLCSSFCIFQMYMRDSLHQIDHGIIIHVLRGILRLFLGNNV